MLLFCSLFNICNFCSMLLLIKKKKKFHLHLIYIFFMACIVVKLAILVFNARMVLLFANGLFFSFFPFWQPGNCEPPSHRCLNTMPGIHQRLCFVNTNVLFSFFLLSFAAGYFFCSFFFVFSVPPAWHLYRSSEILVLFLPLRSHPLKGTIQMEKSILSR